MAEERLYESLPFTVGTRQAREGRRCPKDGVFDKDCASCIRVAPCFSKGLSLRIRRFAFGRRRAKPRHSSSAPIGGPAEKVSAALSSVDTKEARTFVLKQLAMAPRYVVMILRQSGAEKMI